MWCASFLPIEWDHVSVSPTNGLCPHKDKEKPSNQQKHVGEQKPVVILTSYNRGGD